MNVHATLEGLMFDNFLFSSFVNGIVRAKVSIFLCIFDAVVMSVLVKGGVFDLIGRRRTKNLVVLCESHNDWF